MAEAPRGGPPTPVREILESEIEAGLRELHRPSRGLSLSALSAGLDLGFGPFLMAAIATFGHELPEGVRTLLLANAYAVGFILVVLGRSELFTEHTTMAAMPVLAGRAEVGRLMRVWGIVYAGNLVGAVVFSVLGALVGPSLGVAERGPMVEIAARMVSHPWWVMLLSAVLAGWLMGLLSWMLRGSQETISQIAIVWIVTASIGLAHLHHCIAGSIEVLLGVFVSWGADVGFTDFAWFLLWSTIGNVIGGVVFVGAVKLGHARRPSHRE